MIINANRPMGLRPVGTISGTQYNGAARLYAIEAANVSAFAIGDPVVTSPAGADFRGVPFVNLAAGTGALRGVVVSLFDSFPTSRVDNLNQIIRTAGAKAGLWYAMVADDPGLVFEVQEVGTGTPLPLIDVGLNTNLIPGVNNGFISGWQLDNVSRAVTATLQCKILGLAIRPDNVQGQFAKWLVTINNHEFSAGTVGI
ncbi:MAG: hypothetical protein DDT31_01699 [Syntrophomonadaceae bacterium]|nr:hypothetical protein [Bacillota bacterium]